MAKLRVAVIEYRLQSGRSTSRTFAARLTPSWLPVARSSMSQEIASAFGAQLGIDRAVGDYSELLFRPVDRRSPHLHPERHPFRYR